MSINYLDPGNVLKVSKTKAPNCYSRTGYGAKLPTQWMLTLADKRARRVYVICFSNSGSAYIIVRGKPVYLGGYEPGYEYTRQRIAPEDIAS